MSVQTSRYRESLHRWGAQQVGDGAEVVSVDITYDDGFDPTFTDRPESLSVLIGYREAGRVFYVDRSMEILTSVGELLTELFRIEEDTPPPQAEDGDRLETPEGTYERRGGEWVPL